MLGEYKATTVNRKLSALKVFMRWAADLGLVERQAMPRLQHVTLPRQIRSRPRCLDPGEQLQLLRSVKSGKSSKDKAAITLMLHSGIRASELCSLRWGDVTIRNNAGAITLRRGKGRNPTSIPLSKETCKAMQRMGHSRQTDKNQQIFAGPSGPATRRWVDMLVERHSRIARLNNVTPSTLRHTSIANLANAGADPFTVAEFAGWASLEMTRGFFDLPPFEGLEAAVEYQVDQAQQDVRTYFRKATEGNLSKQSDDESRGQDKNDAESFISSMIGAMRKLPASAQKGVKRTVE
jgi:integrase/recombinase XerD